VSTEKSWHTIFDVEFESRKSYAAELASFERHKTALLDILRKAHDQGPKSKPFDEQPAWRALLIAAAWYFRRPVIKRNTLHPARRFERLDDLAKALSRARSIVHKAMQDDAGIDLFRGWWTETKRNTSPVLEQDIDAVADEITEAVAKLAALEAAARKAARAFPKKVGPQSGTGILSMHDIIALKGLYRWSTGREPRRGPFVQLVEEFLVAVGRSDTTKQDYVVEALKYADKQARKYK
jgi:hypothetical protein